jgi:hypothetical protein
VKHKAVVASVWELNICIPLLIYCQKQKYRNFITDASKKVFVDENAEGMKYL